MWNLLKKMVSRCKPHERLTPTFIYQNCKFGAPSCHCRYFGVERQNTWFEKSLCYKLTSDRKVIDKEVDLYLADGGSHEGGLPLGDNCKGKRTHG